MLITIIMITLGVGLIVMYEWRKLNQTKEKMVVIILMAAGYVIAVLLLFFPRMPGPTQLTEAVYKPLTKLLEK